MVVTLSNRREGNHLRECGFEKKTMGQQNTLKARNNTYGDLRHSTMFQKYQLPMLLLFENCLDSPYVESGSTFLMMSFERSRDV